MSKKKFVTIKDAEKVSGVHYTLNHSGKMSGMQSLSTSCLRNPYCQARRYNPELICSHCYAHRFAHMYSSLSKRLEGNTEILTSRILKEYEIPTINSLYFRFEAFGDLINKKQVINYFNICLHNKKVKFGLWTKNPQIIEQVLRSGWKKPNNLQIILSSPKINEPVECKYDFVDKIFTVYDKKYIKKHNIEINCGGEQCLTCGKCYCKSKGKNINEMLK